MSIDIIKFAEYLVSYCNSKGEPITNKKLQKLLYYLQAWHLVYFGEPLFDEVPQAWVHGPVFPSVYSLYSPFTYKPICNTGDEEPDRQKLEEQFNSFGLSLEQKKFVDSVINHYGSMSAIQLELATHSEDPWCDAREGLKDWELSSNPISFESMTNYYKKRIMK